MHYKVNAKMLVLNRRCGAEHISRGSRMPETLLTNVSDLIMIILRLSTFSGESADSPLHLASQRFVIVLVPKKDIRSVFDLFHVGTSHTCQSIFGKHVVR